MEGYRVLLSIADGIGRMGVSTDSRKATVVLWLMLSRPILEWM